MAITDLLFGYPIIFWTAAHKLDQDHPAQCRTEADFTRLLGTSRDRTDHEGKGERLPSASVN